MTTIKIDKIARRAAYDYAHGRNPMPGIRRIKSPRIHYYGGRLDAAARPGDFLLSVYCEPVYVQKDGLFLRANQARVTIYRLFDADYAASESDNVLDDWRAAGLGCKIAAEAKYNRMD